MTIPDSSIALPLSQDYTAYISAEDADLAAFKWTASPSHNGEVIYAYRSSWNGTKQKHIDLHRSVMERMLGRSLDHTEQVDHRDLNGLNNTRENLRLATISQNKGNTKRSRSNTSGYKGVSWHTRVGRWRAVIKHEQKQHHLGYFDTPEEAHEAYKAAALRLFKEFANEG